MKIFQITQLNESPQKATRLADKILSKWGKITKPSAATDSPTSPSAGGSDASNVNATGSSDSAINRAAPSAPSAPSGPSSVSADTSAPTPPETKETINAWATGSGDGTMSSDSKGAPGEVVNRILQYAKHGKWIRAHMLAAKIEDKYWLGLDGKPNADMPSKADILAKAKKQKSDLGL